MALRLNVGKIEYGIEKKTLQLAAMSFLILLAKFLEPVYGIKSPPGRIPNSREKGIMNFLLIFSLI